MAPAIIAAALAAGARHAGLRVIPDAPDGSETMVKVGDLLGPSLRHNARGEPIGGLHRGTSVIGFRCRMTLAAAIEAASFHIGRQVVLVVGSGSHRTDEDREERIIVGARIAAIWVRRYSGGGRVLAWPPEDHADW